MHKVHSVKHLSVGWEEMGVRLVVVQQEGALLLNTSRRGMSRLTK